MTIHIGTLGKLDDDVAFILAKAAEYDLPLLGTMTAPAARDEFRRRLARTGPPMPEGVEIRDLQGGPVPMRLYGTGASVLVFFHGGGFVVGGIDTHHAVCATIAARSGSRVVSVDYRLAPEHPYPAAAEDAVAALDWVAAGGLGDVPARLGVAGDSAGATLAAVAALHARDAGIPLALQALVYPAVDQGGDYPSRKRLAEGYMLTEADIVWFGSQYFGPIAAPVLAPTASPIRAPSHAGLAPALVITAGFDPLVDEGDAYAAKLAAAGVAVRHVRLEGAIHGCLGLAGLLACGRTVIDEICAAWG